MDKVESMEEDELMQKLKAQIFSKKEEEKIIDKASNSLMEAAMDEPVGDVEEQARSLLAKCLAYSLFNKHLARIDHEQPLDPVPLTACLAFHSSMFPIQLPPCY